MPETTAPAAPPIPDPAPAPAPGPARSTPLVAAGVASLGAGAIHAAAIGVHNEHRAAVVAFTLVALAQLGWGALALTRGGRLVAAAGTVVSLAAVGGWLLAKTVGIGFVAGLDEAESVQLADGAAAALAAVAVALVLRDLLVPAGLAGPGAPAPAPRPPRVPLGLRRGALVVGVAGLSVAAMISAGSHSHAGGHAHGDEVAAGGHAHAGSEAGAEHEHPAGEEHPAGAEHADGEAHAAAVPAKAYDPALPIDLGGVEGVTPTQQAAAENLIAITLLRLPQFADPAVAEAAGYKSIGDGFLGHEHLIKWDYLSDGRILDPDHPESLVYETGGGQRRLVSAMFMMEPGGTLDTVPELGGALTQWHIHDNLCFTAGDHPRVVGLTGSNESCTPPLQKFTPVPMIHVWITPHPCGPFAALEGVAAGQVKPGEEHLCDHAHGT